MNSRTLSESKLRFRDDSVELISLWANWRGRRDGGVFPELCVVGPGELAHSFLERSNQLHPGGRFCVFPGDAAYTVQDKMSHNTGPF